MAGNGCLAHPPQRVGRCGLELDVCWSTMPSMLVRLAMDSTPCSPSASATGRSRRREVCGGLPARPPASVLSVLTSSHPVGAGRFGCQVPKRRRRRFPYDEFRRQDDVPRDGIRWPVNPTYQQPDRFPAEVICRSANRRELQIGWQIVKSIKPHNRKVIRNAHPPTPQCDEQRLGEVVIDAEGGGRRYGTAEECLGKGSHLVEDVRLDPPR